MYHLVWQCKIPKNHLRLCNCLETLLISSSFRASSPLECAAIKKASLWVLKKRRVWHQQFLWSSFVLCGYRKIHQESGFQLMKAYVVPKRGRPFKTPVTSESCWRARVGDETWLIRLSGHLTGPVSSSASHWSSLPTYAACKPALSLVSKQSRWPESIKRAPCSSSISQEGLPYLSKAFPVESNCNIVICEELVYNREGISGDHICSNDIFGRGPYIIEGFSVSCTLPSATSYRTATTSRTQEWKV